MDKSDVGLVVHYDISDSLENYVQEAGVFGVPLFFGPHYSKFNEAVMLVQQKGAFSITTAAEMLAVLQHFDSTPAYYEETCRICKQYVEDNIGAVDKIYSGICKI